MHQRRVSRVRLLASPLAIRSTPVVAISPPLRVVDVAIERSPVCVPLRSMGVTHFLTTMGTSDFLWTIGPSPVCRLCHPTPIPGRTQRISRVPDSAVVTCPGLRPRWVLWSHSQSAPAIWPSILLTTSAPTFHVHNGAQSFTLARCGPSPPCVRFAVDVTASDATLGTRCLARASGVRTYP